jgi:hypothetical protein
MTEQTTETASAGTATSTPQADNQQPLRRTVASFIRYVDAEAAVEYLAEQQFPIDRVAIVGEDVRMIEQIVGRVNYWRAAMHGAGSGAVPGVLIGWLFGVFDWFHPVIASVALALYGLLFGAVIGALLGVFFHALQHGRRDFVAVQAILPSRYELMVGDEVADEAARLLQERDPGRRVRASTAPN